LGSMKAALSSFSVYVPKEVVRAIVASGAESVVGGVRQPVSVLFTDLVGFTASSEGLDPEEVLHRLSEYFDTMSEAIHWFGGTVDKYIGDAVMALFNAPVADPDHAASGCRAMLACREAGRRLNAEIAERGGMPLRTRLGLHCDWVVVGNVGSSTRMQYTALGPGVNLASRIEGLNKTFGTEMLVTGAIEEAVRGRFRLRPLGPVVPAGTSQPVPLFELLGAAEDDDPRAAELLRAWEAPFAAYGERRWDDAVRGCTALAEAWPEDGPARLLRDAAITHRRTPPGPDWDGALRFDSK
jgi:adenylate cyclase